MAKPSITKRTVKNAALTYAELDTNFQNLADATISIDADGNVIILDLNDTVTLTPGDNVTFSVSGNDITINAEGGGQLDVNKIVVGDQNNTNSVAITPDLYGKSLSLGQSGWPTNTATPYISINGFDDSNIMLFCSGGGSLQINGNAVSFTAPVGYTNQVIGYWKVIVPGYPGVSAYIELKK
jgi:hypothetical protein